MLWLGIGDAAKTIIVFLGTILPILVSTYHGAASVDHVYIWSARSMGDDARTLLWRVVFRAALPEIMSGIRNTPARAWPWQFARHSASVLIRRVAASPIERDLILVFWFPVPKVGLIPIALLFFGLGHGSKIALVFVDALLPLVIATYQGALRIDNRLVWSARSMGDSDFKILSRVVLPGTLPQILTGFRLAVTVSLLVVFLAEMVASSSGLGQVMIYALRTLETKDVFSTLIAMSLLAFIADGLVLVLRRRLLVWSE
jgi:ABC-type nitrate/sulfonate/bicarbonate transport system permease component